jgi:hypothetical protein
MGGLFAFIVWSMVILNVIAAGGSSNGTELSQVFAA